jgi:hypothetical protein
MTKHLVIPDTQVRPGTPMDHFTAIGNYIAVKQPDTVVHIGDHWDMHSLSSYDLKQAGFANRSYSDDIEAGNEAMRLLMAPIKAYNKGRKKKYTPRMVLTLGNHEERINRFREDAENARFRDVVTQKDFDTAGWKVVPFKKVIKIDGINYAHYFYAQNSGRPIGGLAQFKLTKLKFSYVMGHQQEMSAARESLANGQIIRGLMAGCCYQHEEVYRGPQAKYEWRGVHMLHEVNKGDYSHCEVSLKFLRGHYL